ncbi:MAG: hypothetical protein IT323_06650 [Anaerolineae bacterium]|nr:hypothetical protein [Anaerolineae bacterium]
MSQPNRRRAARRLRDLPDGEHRAPVEVPYTAQFATPALIRAYIHDGLDGAQDTNRAAFGAAQVDPAEYAFWAHRACAIACVKMAIDAFQSAPPASMWQLIQDGLALDGYRVHDERGVFVDQGWFYPPLAELAARNGLETRGMAYASTLDVCAAIRDGWVIAAAVTPELGEHGPLRRYDGHFVIVYGFVWRRRRPERFLVHNPSGRYADLQAGARIPAGRFGRAFAHRFIALRRK